MDELTMPGADKLARMFKVLSIDTRVRIVEILKTKALCVNALAHRLGITPAAVSQHLRIMRDAGIALPDKRGYHVHYTLNEEALARWKQMAEGFLDLKAVTKGDSSCATKKRKSAGNRKI